MKICLVSNTSKSFWLFRKKIINTLINKEFSVYLFCNKDEYASLFNNKKIKFIFIKNKFNAKNPLNFFFLFFEVFYKIFLIKPRIVQSYTIVPNLICPIISKLLGAISFVMITGLGSVFYQKNTLSVIISFIYKYNFKIVDHIFYTNNKEKFFLKNLDQKNLIKSTKIYGAGIDLSRFRKTKAESKLVKNNIINSLKKKTKKKFTILFVGRLTRDKGIEDLIKIFKSLKINNKYLIIVGKKDIDNPTHIPDIEEKIKNLNNTTYISESFNLSQIYLIADLFVFPSYGEGMPTVIMESMALNLPSIVYNVNGCSEAVRNNYNGFVVQKGNTSAMVKKIELLASNEKLKNKMSKYCSLSYKKFDQNLIVTKVVDTYLKTLSNGL